MVVGRIWFDIDLISHEDKAIVFAISNVVGLRGIDGGGGGGINNLDRRCST